VNPNKQTENEKKTKRVVFALVVWARTAKWLEPRQTFLFELTVANSVRRCGRGARACFF
jgi:hypothetical protein